MSANVLELSTPEPSKLPAPSKGFEAGISTIISDSPFVFFASIYHLLGGASRGNTCIILGANPGMPPRIVLDYTADPLKLRSVTFGATQGLFFFLFFSVNRYDSHCLIAVLFSLNQTQFSQLLHRSCLYLSR